MKKGYINYKLKAAIVERGLTYADVAKAIDISTSTLSKKINGIAVFDEYEMHRISEYLKKDIADIFFNRELPNVKRTI
jgi:transcriptional regulator with XRE-family HTH domain